MGPCNSLVPDFIAMLIFALAERANSDPVFLATLNF